MWALWTSAQRARTEWRLLLVTCLVALIASTLIASLGVLVSVTEQSGLRTELATAADTEIEVTTIKPSVTIESVNAAADAAVQTALGASIDVDLTSSIARSAVYPLPQLSGEKAALAYLGEDSSIRENAELVSGAWPSGPGTIALPDAAKSGFGLALGDSVVVSVGDELVTVEIVATYAADDPQSAYWRDDPAKGLGFDPNFPLPGTRAFIPTNAMGPLLFAPGGMDAADVTVARLDTVFQPDFSRVNVAELAGLAYRLGGAGDDVPADMGDVGSFVVYFSALDETMENAASGLTVTRSTVVVAILMLLVLAVAALAQTARLLFEGRTAERRLLQSRGASRSQVLRLSLIEAAAIGLITFVGSPLLALLAYRILAAQPPMVDAGMPAEAPLLPSTILISGGVASVFILILMAPLLRRSRGEVARGTRQRRLTGLMSSGLDIGLIALAIVAYWQLSSYRTPVEQSATLAVDPLLVVGPAIALLAGALLLMRFVPLLARLLEKVATRSTGTLLPLAAWEVARRSQRAIAAVLLLTLAVAVATFSLSFLATWKQSQVDQADTAVGAPMRVPAVESEEIAQESELGDPQPTTRRQVTVAGPNAFADGITLPSGTAAVIVALTPGARELIADGRVGTSGGAALQAPLDEVLPASVGIDVDVDSLRGFSATVQLGNRDAPMADTFADVRVVLESHAGRLSTLSFGPVPFDGNPQQVSAEFAEPIAAPIRIVGFQVESITPDDESTATDESATGSGGSSEFLVADLSALSNDALVATEIVVPPDGWFVSPPARQSPFAELLPASGGWQIGVEFTVPDSLDRFPLRLAVTGWNPHSTIPAVITDDLAQTMNVSPGMASTIVISGTTVAVSLQATAPLIPGSGLGTVLSNRNQPELGAIAVDQAALFRALVVAGVAEMPLDEWWVDVPRGDSRRIPRCSRRYTRGVVRCQL